MGSGLKRILLRENEIDKFDKINRLNKKKISGEVIRDEVMMKEDYIQFSLNYGDDLYEYHYIGCESIEELFFLYNLSYRYGRKNMNFLCQPFHFTTFIRKGLCKSLDELFTFPNFSSSILFHQIMKTSNYWKKMLGDREKVKGPALTKLALYSQFLKLDYKVWRKEGGGGRGGKWKKKKRKKNRTKKGKIEKKNSNKEKKPSYVVFAEDIKTMLDEKQSSTNHNWMIEEERLNEFFNEEKKRKIMKLSIENSNCDEVVEGNVNWEEFKIDSNEKKKRRKNWDESGELNGKQIGKIKRKDEEKLREAMECYYMMNYQMEMKGKLNRFNYTQYLHNIFHPFDHLMEMKKNNNSDITMSNDDDGRLMEEEKNWEELLEELKKKWKDIYPYFYYGILNNRYRFTTLNELFHCRYFQRYSVPFKFLLSSTSTLNDSERGWRIKRSNKSSDEEKEADDYFREFLNNFEEIPIIRNEEEIDENYVSDNLKMNENKLGDFETYMNLFSSSKQDERTNEKINNLEEILENEETLEQYLGENSIKNLLNDPNQVTYPRLLQELPILSLHDSFDDFQLNNGSEEDRIPYSDFFNDLCELSEMKDNYQIMERKRNMITNNMIDENVISKWHVISVFLFMFDNKKQYDQLRLIYAHQSDDDGIVERAINGTFDSINFFDSFRYYSMNSHLLSNVDEGDDKTLVDFDMGRNDDDDDDNLTIRMSSDNRRQSTDISPPSPSSSPPLRPRERKVTQDKYEDSNLDEIIKKFFEIMPFKDDSKIEQESTDGFLTAEELEKRRIQERTIRGGAVISQHKDEELDEIPKRSRKLTKEEKEVEKRKKKRKEEEWKNVENMETRLRLLEECGIDHNVLRFKEGQKKKKTKKQQQEEENKQMNSVKESMRELIFSRKLQENIPQRLFSDSELEFDNVDENEDDRQIIENNRRFLNLLVDPSLMELEKSKGNIFHSISIPQINNSPEIFSEINEIKNEFYFRLFHPILSVKNQWSLFSWMRSPATFRPWTNKKQTITRLRTKKILQSQLHRLSSSNEIDFLISLTDLLHLLKSYSKMEKSGSRSIKNLLRMSEWYQLKSLFNSLINEMMELNRINDTLINVEKCVYANNIRYNFQTKLLNEFIDQFLQITNIAEDYGIVHQRLVCEMRKYSFIPYAQNMTNPEVVHHVNMLLHPPPKSNEEEVICIKGHIHSMINRACHHISKKEAFKERMVRYYDGKLSSHLVNKDVCKYCGNHQVSIDKINSTKDLIKGHQVNNYNKLLETLLEIQKRFKAKLTSVTNLNLRLCQFND
ncbi:hypothetical protein SNEBB_011413 [Seison nebaliae]|nr:hypothetical protein SNEBB_011413 [Seison nebaliae]